MDPVIMDTRLIRTFCLVSAEFILISMYVDLPPIWSIFVLTGDVNFPTTV